MRQLLTLTLYREIAIVAALNWCCGLTTVPERCEDLLPATIESLVATGFPAPTIFMDGPCEGLYKLPMQVVNFHPKVGHLSNWMTALFHLYITNPKADRYAIFEDDFITCSNLREYLDSQELPLKVYWNLLTHDVNLAKAGPDEGWHESNQKGKGAVALVFSPQAVRDLLTNIDFVNRQKGRANSADGTVIDLLKPMGYKEWIHNPSLVQHVGLVSSLGHKYGPVRGFRSTEYNPMELLQGCQT